MISTSMLMILLQAPLSIHASTAEGDKLVSNTSDQAQSKSAYRFEEVLSLLSTLHISGASKDKLLDAALQGMVDSLDDPYTEYYEPSKGNEFQNAVNGQRVGLGFHLAINDKGTYVNQIFQGTPAEQGGLRAGDYLLAVGGQQVSTLSQNALNQVLSGKKEGDSIAIMILRGEEKKLLTLTYASIQYPIVTHNLFNGKIGYIRVYTFSWNAELEFAKALEDLQSQGMTSLIVDLRDNGGGYVEVAQKLAEHFIENGVFMYEKKQGVSEPQPVEIKEGHSLGLPVSVLINTYSASASEMFAGFMQDHKLATIIGTRSYGKGVAQQVIPLISGGTLKVTSMEWLTPQQHKVNEVGIEPDIEVSGEIETLLRGLLALHTKQLDLELTDTMTFCNQVELPVNVPFKKVGENYYVPARLLAALAQAEIHWDASSQVVTIKSNSSDVGYHVSSVVTGDAFLLNGTSWVQLDAFQKQLSKLSWTASGQELTIHLSQE
ncbi:hypothetical protein A8709_05675 [Paenibacillus pectinilyticus]|uniref:PDZ domain-containing protein n=1 Tax=Paenibacillus pectinilyticus TaxID=512399 RepID=A0A1C0ZSY2_9BACL|nr:S41 family peptidase [Paenibacillus pectinilyticus]OCT11171.1 hypothetical protein A8709_05675 [Paenibacillus pectinilyticus]